MTPKQLKAARLKLSFTLPQMARALGYRGNYAKDTVWGLENDKGTIRKRHEDIIEAFLGGFRPKDWPEDWP